MKRCYGCTDEKPESEAGLDTSRKKIGKVDRERVTRELVATFLDYDPETGAFTAKTRRGRMGADKPVGTITPRGYLRICVAHHVYAAHRLAWLLSYGKWPSDVINHKNGNKLDNRLCNLEDIPHEENTRHAHRTGLIRLPGAKTTVKLTPQQALEIRASALPTSELARDYGVSPSTIEDIRHGRTWKHAEHLAARRIVMSNGSKRLGAMEGNKG